MNYIPLAEKMRPKILSDVFGQDHVIGEGQILTELTASDEPFSVILWGPAGSGKTTIARIIASKTEAEFVELSAVSASKKDVTQVIEDARVNRRLGQRTILFIDEIHRFNKSQQDAFLPHVESGLITLVGATTENPSFEVINPLISRSRIIVLKPIDKKSIMQILERAIAVEKINKSAIKKQDLALIAQMSGGDARKALGILELSIKLAKGRKINKEIIEQSAQARIPSYDKNGDMHYNIVSAFIKSMRGSDANASLYYLARMLDAGEDPKFIARRMIIFASEDIGIAASAALNLAVATFQAVERIGLPECQYNLFHCALVLAKSNKSRVVTNAMNKANEAAKTFNNLDVPNHLKNAPTKLMEDLGYQSDYQWTANFRPEEGFLPREIADLDLFN